MSKVKEMNWIMGAVVESTEIIFGKPVGVVLIIYDMEDLPIPTIQYHSNMQNELIGPIISTINESLIKNNSTEPTSGRC